MPVLTPREPDFIAQAAQRVITEVTASGTPEEV